MEYPPLEIDAVRYDDDGEKGVAAAAARGRINPEEAPRFMKLEEPWRAGRPRAITTAADGRWGTLVSGLSKTHAAPWPGLPSITRNLAVFSKPVAAAVVAAAAAHAGAAEYVEHVAGQRLQVAARAALRVARARDAALGRGRLARRG